MKIKDSDRYSEQETRKRYEAALRGAFGTPAKPMREISPKRQSAKRTTKKKQPITK
jgi:hypothetical protein